MISFLLNPLVQAQTLMYSSGSSVFQLKSDTKDPEKIIESETPVTIIGVDTNQHRIQLRDPNFAASYYSSENFSRLSVNERIQTFESVPNYNPSGSHYINHLSLYQAQNDVFLRSSGLKDFQNFEGYFISDHEVAAVATTYAVRSNWFLIYNFSNMSLSKQVKVPVDYSVMFPMKDKQRFIVAERFNSYQPKLFIIDRKSSVLEKIESPLNLGSVERIFGLNDSADRFYVQTSNGIFSCNPDSNDWHTLARPTDNKYLSFFCANDKSFAWVLERWSGNVLKQEIEIRDFKNPEVVHTLYRNEDNPRITGISFLNQTAETFSTQSSDKFQVQFQRQLDVQDIFYSNKGNYFITSPANDDHITLWDNRSLRQIRKIPVQLETTHPQPVVIDEDRQQIFCMCKDKFRIIDLNTGRVLKVFSRSYHPEGFSTEINQLIDANGFFEKEGIRIFSIKTSEQTGSKRGDYNRLMYSASLHKWLGVYKHKKVVLLDTNFNRHGKTFRIKRKHDYLYDYKISPDGTRLLMVYPIDAPIFSGGMSPWEVYDIKSGKRIANGKFRFGDAHAEFSPDGKSFYFIHYADSVDEEGYNFSCLYRFDLIRKYWDPVVTFYTDGGTTAFSLHPDGDYAMLSVDGNLRSVRLDKKRFEREAPSCIQVQYTAVDYFNDKNVLVRNGNTLHELDFSNPREYRYHKDTTNAYRPFHLAGSGYWLVEDTSAYRESGENYDMVYTLLKAGEAKPVASIALHNEILLEAQIIEKRNEVLLFTFGSEPDEKYRIVKFDLKKRVLTDGLSFPGERVATDKINKLQLSKDQTTLIFPGYDELHQDILHFVSISGDSIWVTGSAQSFNCAIFHRTARLAFVGKSHYAGSEISLFDFKNNLVLKRVGLLADGINSMVVSQDGKWLLVTGSKNMFRFALEDPEMLEKVRPHNVFYPLDAVANDSGFVIVDYNEIIQYDLELNERYRIISGSEEGVFVVLPDGKYFVFAGKVPEYIHYSVGRNAYTFDQFDLQNNRPAEVLKEMGKASEKLLTSFEEARNRRMKRFENLPDNPTSVPVIELNRTEIPLHVSDSTFQFNIRCTDSQSALKYIHVWINGVPVWGKNGKPANGNTIHTLEQKIVVTLGSGMNTIEVSCSNTSGLESLRESFQIQLDDEPATPILHFIPISISDYRDTRFRLKYADKDGHDLMNAFIQHQKNYRIEVDSFFNESVTRENILRLKERLLKTSVNDAIVIFVSGHGLLDTSFNWWFATCDMDFSDPPKRGISYEELEWLLDSVPARKKLLLVDACHSGEVDKESMLPADTFSENDSLRLVSQNFKGGKSISKSNLGLLNSFNLMQELFVNLSRGSGTEIIAAAAGNSYALESDKWKNGVFTYSVISALNDPDADQNHDGYISVNELQQFVIPKVEALTGGAQKPVMRQGSVLFDFPVY